MYLVPSITTSLNYYFETKTGSQQQPIFTFKLFCLDFHLLYYHHPIINTSYLMRLTRLRHSISQSVMEPVPVYVFVPVCRIGSKWKFSIYATGWIWCPESVIRDFRHSDIHVWANDVKPIKTWSRYLS